MDFEQAYNKWAEDRYGLPDVTSVEFSTSWYEGCPTCGDSETTVEVFIRYGDGRYTNREESFGTHLINSIMASAVKHA